MNSRAFAIFAAIAVALAILIPTLLLRSCELTNSDLPQTNGKGQDFGDSQHR